MYNKNREHEVEEKTKKHDNGDVRMWHFVVLMIEYQYLKSWNKCRSWDVSRPVFGGLGLKAAGLAYIRAKI